MVIFHSNHCYVLGLDLEDQPPLAVETNRVLMLALPFKPFRSKAAPVEVPRVLSGPDRLHGLPETADDFSTEPRREGRVTFEAPQVLIGEHHSQLDNLYIACSPLWRNHTFTPSVKMRLPTVRVSGIKFT